MANSSENQSSSNDQQEEISSLRDYFKDDIRILSAIGQFSYILKIRADQYDVSLTLQLDESYPSKAPEIIITAPRLTPDQISIVQQLLQSYCETLLSKPMILAIYSRLLQWFAENNIQTLNLNSNNNNNNNLATPSNNSDSRSRSSSKASIHLVPALNQNKTSQADDYDSENIKKTSMKTAEDVISRIEWDECLDRRFFRVGYLDRFLGLQEKAFTDFDFKVDLSTVSDKHSNILAIPKHRVQYFKYNNEIIWDKDTRTDLMFGSTGNQETIYDVIKRHENLMENNGSPSIIDNGTVEDEDIEVPLPRYLTLTDGAYKPNYYLSIPITDPNLITQYNAFRGHLFSLFSQRPNTSDPPHLHLTLLTFRIETPSQIEQCTSALKRLQEEIRYHCSYPEPMCLEFDGIDTFHDKVVYMKCKPNQRLENLRTLIVERFSEQQQKEKLNDVYFAGNYYQFIPHVTLFKCKRRFSSMSQNESRDILFGKQTIESLQLRSIGKNQSEEQNNNCLFQLNMS